MRSACFLLLLAMVALAVARSPKKARAGKLEDLNLDFGGLNLGSIMCQVRGGPTPKPHDFSTSLTLQSASVDGQRPRRWGPCSTCLSRYFVPLTRQPCHAGEISREEMNKVYMRYRDNDDMINAACGVLGQLGISQSECQAKRDADGLTDLVRAVGGRDFFFWVWGFVPPPSPIIGLGCFNQPLTWYGRPIGYGEA